MSLTAESRWKHGLSPTKIPITQIQSCYWIQSSTLSFLFQKEDVILGLFKFEGTDLQATIYYDLRSRSYCIKWEQLKVLHQQREFFSFFKCTFKAAMTSNLA